MKIHVLVTDDEQSIRRYVSNSLEKAGYVVHAAEDAACAVHILDREKIHIAIVDVMMPGKNGFDLCKEIKEDYNIPVIMLTARSELNDKRQAFQAGTDDYVTKPFEVEELIFRIDAVLSRYEKLDETVVIGDLTLYNSRYEIAAGDNTLLLPRKEFELLYELASHYPNVLSRDTLIERVWGYDYDGDERTVDVHIKRIRKRLAVLSARIEIKTVRGVGYSIHET